MSQEPLLAWHMVRADRRLGHGRRRIVQAGETYRCGGALALCQNGLHASVRALDALSYAQSGLISRVEVGGEIVDGADKLCARWRRVLWIADATATLHEFACWCAEQALLRERGLGREPDARAWAAVAAKRRWLRGEIGDVELGAARAAARDAARDAAWGAAWAAAWDAAWGAAWAAARDAARDAAWGAAWAAAPAAAWDAAWATQNAELERRLLALGPGEVGAPHGETGEQP